ncbi:hypothetical protein BROUX41_004222 [Berkeleyomyces rouxiae]|uniref:uncharacterized protein n=1 Tax=Berkeleyomyces rouxiae TaxID=2035830 RepID=UPI003B7B82D9
MPPNALSPGHRHRNPHWIKAESCLPSSHDAATAVPNFRAGLNFVSQSYLKHSGGQRINSEVYIADKLRASYPKSYVAIVPSETCDLIRFANSGQATCVFGSSVLTEGDAASKAALENKTFTPGMPCMLHLSHRVKVYVPPTRRMDGATGQLMEEVIFDMFNYTWQENEFKLYIVDGRDGSGAYPVQHTAYLIGDDQKVTDSLVLAAAQFQGEVHQAVMVFEGGQWMRSTSLYESTMKASWDAVILDEGMKKALINDHLSFFNAREKYEMLGVPWKRGVIYHGPPGNGKTISIKAMMHMLYDMDPPVPTLYVRNLVTWAGPEAAIREIFSTARQHAPCYLIFEDLDSLIGDKVRSYFLNEIDGLNANDGIFMVGSTNHLDRLDPGLAKRPSRFDRKYLFPNPNTAQREAYCKFWQRKLPSNDAVKFPDVLCPAIAKITDGFSYAYMQEAFVATLLAIAQQDQDDGNSSDSSGSESSSNRSSLCKLEVEETWLDITENKKHHHRKNKSDDGELSKYVLWREIKKQVEILREGMSEEK